MFKRSILIVLVIHLVILTSCSDTSKSFTFISSNEKLIVKDFDFYISADSAIYLYVEKKHLRNNILNIPLSSVEFQTEDTTYIAKPIQVFYSREMDYTPFIVEINNMTQKIVSIELNDKEMFFIGRKNDIEPFLKRESINPIVITD